MTVGYASMSSGGKGTALCRVGDGDCGSTLKRGAEAIKGDMARCLPLNNAAGTLKGLARTLRVMGGTSGVLYVISLTAAAGELLHLTPCHQASHCTPAEDPPKTKHDTETCKLLWNMDQRGAAKV